MQSLRNQVQLIGNLGRDLEFKTVNEDLALAKVPIATNEFYKNGKGEKVQETQWHNIVAWGKTAELMQSLLNKGDEVALQGRLVHRKYEDSNGQTKYITEIVVDQFVKLSRSETN